MNTIVDIDEEDEEVVRMHCPETLSPGSLVQDTAFLALLHGRKRIGEDRWRRRRREKLGCVYRVSSAERDVSLL
jgi:hypothetical protein